VGTHMTPRKVYGRSELQKVVFVKFYESKKKHLITEKLVIIDLQKKKMLKD